MDPQPINQQPLPPINPSTPPPAPSKLPLILLITFLLLLIGTGSYFLGQKTLKTTSTQPTTTPRNIVTQQPTVVDETANWKTYINTKYNYLFKYPQNWKIAVKGGEDPNTSSSPYFESQCNLDKGDICSSLNISVNEPYEKEGQLDDYLKLTLTGNRPDRLINKKNIKIDNQNAIEMEKYADNYFYGSSEHGVIMINIVTVYNKKIFHLDLLERRKDQANIKTSDDWKNKAIYYQILSTFKFLE